MENFEPAERMEATTLEQKLTFWATLCDRLKTFGDELLTSGQADHVGPWTLARALLNSLEDYSNKAIAAEDKLNDILKKRGK